MRRRVKKGPCLKERDPLLRLGAFFLARRPPRRQPLDARAHDDADDDDDYVKEQEEEEEDDDVEGEEQEEEDGVGEEKEPTSSSRDSEASRALPSRHSPSTLTIWFKNNHE